ncbi:MAG: O-antigen ligase family protein [Candidatus Omnitrophica bacterium]|nr:O-antigen ligase family protein [Candidatus Omnitrophota bacterium]MDD5660374.1 O-antigen ligase family protein [Candidatus Omnitrophota bacterium]
MKILSILDAVIYWSIVIMPFSVAIAPGLANTFIGIFGAFFVIKKLITRQPFSIDRLTLVFFSLFFLFSLASVANSVSFNSSFGGVSKLLKAFLILLVCSQEIKDKRHVQRIIISICAGVTLMSVDALWQVIFGYDFVRHNVLQSAIGMIRPTASFPNPNVFGVYMSALTPVIFGLTFFYFSGRKKILMFFLSVLAFIGIYLTLSRGSGLGVYLAVLFLSIAKRRKILTTALIAVLIIFPFVMPKNIKEWAKQVNYNPLVFMCNQDRISIYNNTINMIRHHPFIGVGLNTFSKNYGKYKLQSAEEYAHTPDTIYAHNIYLHMAGETGLLGLFAFLGFLFVVFKQAARALGKLNDDYLKTVAMCLIACLIAFLINGLTETSLYYSRVSMIFWYLIGFSLALNKFTNEAKSAN